LGPIFEQQKEVQKGEEDEDDEEEGEEEEEEEEEKWRVYRSRKTRRLFNWLRHGSCLRKSFAFQIRVQSFCVPR
jgi:hypothetical protein